MSATPLIEVVHEDGYGAHVSFSQVSRPCGLALRLHREGAKIGHRGIALVYGQAVHEGIEHYVRSGDLAASVRMAHKHIHNEIVRSDQEEAPPIRWDDPPRLTNSGQLYRGDEAKIPTVEVAEIAAAMQVKGWVDTFGSLGAVRLDDIECEVLVPVEGEDGWTIKTRLDLPTDEGGLVDIKTASRPWKDEEIDAKLDQAHIYHLAYLHHFGRPAEYLTFHVGLKGSPRWEVIEVPFDADAIARVLEYRVRPTIRMIRARAYQPNTMGWWHSERSCEFWGECPLGAKARGAGFRVQ